MLKEIACDIEDKVKATGFVQTHFPWCELIKRDGVTFPAQYVGSGNYTTVFNIDDSVGHSYLRKTGKATFSPANVTKYISCPDTTFVDMKIPLRLVVVVPREKLEDNAFSDERLAFEIASALNGVQTVTDVQAKKLEYRVTDYDTDSLSIWKSEVQGVEHQMNFRFAYIALNIDIKLTINPACIEQACTY